MGRKPQGSNQKNGGRTESENAHGRFRKRRALTEWENAGAESMKQVETQITTDARREREKSKESLSNIRAQMPQPENKKGPIGKTEASVGNRATRKQSGSVRKRHKLRTCERKTQAEEKKS